MSWRSLSGCPGLTVWSSWCGKQPSRGSILLEDVHGEPLAGVEKPLEVASLTALAVDLARVVAAIHGRGVIHRDINPGNVVLAEEDRHPVVIDFALATTSAQLRPEFTHHTEIVGTLAYLAPEQTGRTGRPVDQRADLYALGATLYELATGAPPFGTGDPVRLIHDQLARVPTPPARSTQRCRPTCRRSSCICWRRSRTTGTRPPRGWSMTWSGCATAERLVRPGEHDFPVRVLPPSRLVGRDDEIASLAAAFAEVASGRCRGVLVGGAPGVGKTSLIDKTAADRDGQWRLVRGRQVRPVPP